MERRKSKEKKRLLYFSNKASKPPTAASKAINNYKVQLDNTLLRQWLAWGALSLYK